MRREMIELRLKNYWKRNANKYGKWDKKLAFTFLAGTFCKIPQEPDHKLIENQYAIFSENGMIDLKKYIKFLFRVHWLHVRDDIMAKAEG